MIARYSPVCEKYNMNGYDFERCLVETIEQLAELRGIKQEPMAKKAFPDFKSPGARWRQIRNLGQRLAVRDAVELAEILGMSFVEVCGLAQAKLMQKMQGQDVNFRSAERKAVAAETGKEQKSIEA